MSAKRTRSKFYSFDPAWKRAPDGKYLPSDLATRFWAKVDKSGDCWIWTACTSGKFRYGSISVNGRMKGAHRIAYLLRYGHEVEQGKVLRHLCGVKLCVNPDHLEPGTQSENMTDHYQREAENASASVRDQPF